MCVSLAATLRWFSSKRNFIFIEFYPGDSTRWRDETGLVSELISTPSLPTQQKKGCKTSLGSTPPTLYEQQCGFFYISQESKQYKSCETRPKVDWRLFNWVNRAAEIFNETWYTVVTSQRDDENTIKWGVTVIIFRVQCWLTADSNSVILIVTFCNHLTHPKLDK